ncbi:MAG: phospho-N-acetylmuramoyl-pentapeptide-transferase [Planctomycetota bacterium]
MLAELLARLTGAALFEYISFRAALAAFTSFVVALALGGPTIRWLRKHRVGEDVTKTAALELAQLSQNMGKHQTTTMGGSFLVTALLTGVLLWCRLDNVAVVIAMVIVAGMAAVGFVDDYQKLTVKSSNGMSERSKLLGQTIVSVACLGAFVWYARASGRFSLLELHPPFLKDWSLPLGESVLGALAFTFLGWLVIAGTANATNITDGMDGLLAGCTVASGGALAVFCYVTGRFDWTEYLNLPYVPEAAEMAVVGGALVGAALGFLWFNAFPAAVFMGDSGSLPIGGLLGWMALVAKQELVLPLIGAVFFLELGSIWLQRFWYKRSGGRRVFTMAPIHHGLQLKGGIFRPGPKPWHEVTVVVRAWIIAAVCATASLALMKVR